MKITIFDGVNDTRPSIFEASWPELCEVFSEMSEDVTCHRSDKLNHKAMIPGLCVGRRANDNVEFLSALSADFDTYPDDPRYVGFHGFCDKLAREGFAFFAFTTTKNCKAHNRFRVVLPFAGEVPQELCRSAWQTCNEKFGSAIDPATKDPARLSFLPCAWTGNPFHDSTHGQMTLDEPFNAYRMKAKGNPILSAAEIAALAPMPGSVRSAPMVSPAIVRVGVSHSPAFGGADWDAFAHGHKPDSPVWSLVRSIERSPYLSIRKLEKLAANPGARDYRFLLATLYRAASQKTPINIDVLVELAEQFSRNYLMRPPPDDLRRQAQNAFEFVISNPDPRQPEAGKLNP